MGSKEKVRTIRNGITDYDIDDSIVFKYKLMPANKKSRAEVDRLANYLRTERVFEPAKTMHELEDLALTNILTNLIASADKDKPLAYSRNKSNYSKMNKMYGHTYYKYERYMNIIDGLIAHELVWDKLGYYDLELEKGKNSRMIMSTKFRQIREELISPFERLSLDYFYVSQAGEYRYVADNSLVTNTSEPPLISVVLKSKAESKSKTKNLVPYIPNSKVRKMIQQLEEYNTFINSVPVILAVEESDLKSNDDKSAFKVETMNLSKLERHHLEQPNNEQPGVGLFDLLRTANVFNPEWVFDEHIARKEYEQPWEVELGSTDKRRRNKYWRKNEAADKSGIMTYTEVEVTTLTKSEAYEVVRSPVITNTNPRKLCIGKPLRCHLYRVFNNSRFDNGGRFYGADYQQLSGDERQRIILHDSPVVEADYSSFHTRMIYHQIGVDIKHDPYDLYDGNKSLRKAVKLLMNIAINAENKRDAIYAFNDKVYGKKKDKKNVKKKDTKKNKNKEEEYKAISIAMSLHSLETNDLYEKIIKSHPQISKYISSGEGVRLQFIDSQIAADILQHFTRKQVPCLCVHDSFIVPKKYGDELKQVMMDFYFERFKFYPVVDFKQA